MNAERDPGQNRMPLLLVWRLAKSSSSKQETSFLIGLVRMSTETVAQFQGLIACGRLRCLPSAAVTFVGVAVQ